MMGIGQNQFTQSRGTGRPEWQDRQMKIIVDKVGTEAPGEIPLTPIEISTLNPIHVIDVGRLDI